MLGRRAVQIGDFKFLRELQGDGISADKVDAVDIFALVNDHSGSDENDDPRRNEGRFGVLQEVDVGVLQNREHFQILDVCAIDQEFEQQLADHNRRKHRREDTDAEREAETLHRAGAEQIHDERDEEGRHV